jgi:hypothetical protein
MPHDWQELTRLTSGSKLIVERVRLVETDLVIEGKFDLPPLAQLTAEDQVFVAAFVHYHGSIKEMERAFGVSYPTIKQRLNRLGTRLPLAEIGPGPASEPGDVLGQLERGEITAPEALRRLKGRTP